MNKYKIIYWCGGNRLVCEIEAVDVDKAMYLFYMDHTNADDIISINEVND